MSRYIDADALDKRIYNDIPISVFGSIKKMAAVREIIAEQPTVDAVPVPDGGIGELSKPILCKECIHRPKMPDNHVDGFDLEFPDHKCPCQCEDGFYSWYPADDWFCADGERRSDGEG